MGYFAAFPCFLVLLSFFISGGNGATFEIRNNCPYTVWAAASPGGGRRIDRGQTWILNAPAGTSRIWGRTNCTFDSSGRGSCQTGDCGGVLECTGWGAPPNTVAEFALSRFNNRDFYDISLIDGFNVPIELSPTSSGGGCRGVSCTADINGQCPDPLRVPGGCNHPCTTFKTPEYCCTDGPCGPTGYSRFFKQSCPDAYSSYTDDPTPSTISCPGGTNYRIVFCPRGLPPLQMSRK